MDTGIARSGDVTVYRNLEHALIDYNIEDQYGEGMPVGSEEELRDIRDAIDEALDDGTVRIDRVTLATLLDESRETMNAVDDETWHEGYGAKLNRAIQIGEEALEG